ncbi:MAG: GyrI-like domain-containing protein [Alphaproteobacteria bacterium]|nr:GyrI-like domain-containing protein [Alphaproteobacteria bacterium]
MFNVELIDTDEKRIVGPVLHTSFLDNLQAREVPDFFHRIMDDGTLDAVPDRINANQICAFVKPPDSPEFDYYMAVEVSGFDHVPADMKSLILPACRCATTSLVKRGNADVMAAMRYIMQDWMTANGLRPDFSLPAFIYYDDRFLPIFKAKGYAGNPVAQLFVPVM